MSVPPAAPSLATLALSRDPGVPACLPLDPGVALYKTPLSALQQRWGPGTTTGKADQRDWQQSWFGVADVAASYRFTPDGRLQGIALGLSLPPDGRDRPDGPARQQAAQALAIGDSDERRDAWPVPRRGSSAPRGRRSVPSSEDCSPPRSRRCCSGRS